MADLCGGTTVWTPQAASEVQVLTGVSAPEPGSAGTELPGGPSDTALEAVVAVLFVAAFAGGAGPAATGGRVDRGRRAALLLLPTLSTHGYEVQHRETVERCARLVAEFLCRPVSR